MLIYCSTGLCHHSPVINADGWPDDTVLLDLDPRAICTKCGMIGADVRPNWSERPSTTRSSLVIRATFAAVSPLLPSITDPGHGHPP